jgi:pimeloyl-ACP methyl ester carboxylesterase
MNLIERAQAIPHYRLPIVAGGQAAHIRYAQAGSGPLTLVLLHGIGAGSGSWLRQIDAAQQMVKHARVIAWDAPGYADSTPLPQVVPQVVPQAQDYAERLWALLDALYVDRVRLVGHSLGCIMAASAARLQPHRVQDLVLIAPAQGFGRSSAAVQAKKRDERLHALTTLGVRGMAEQRGPALLAPDASEEHRALATHLLAQMHPAGYTQATLMLAQADIAQDLAGLPCPVTVACGDQDGITPPKGCVALAKSLDAPYMSLGAVGHMAPLEAADAVNALLGLDVPHT